MQLRTTFITLVWLLAASLSHAQDTLDHALLWRVEAPGSTVAPSYLFGTIHLIGADDFLISDSLMQVLNRAESVTFEIDPADMKNPAVAMQLIPKAFMRGDTSLRDLLTTEQYAKVSEHFSDLGLPMMFLDKVKPMFLSMLAGMDGLDLSGMMSGEESSDVKSYEFELDAIARKSNKTIAGLETVDFQMGLFDSIPYRHQAQMLLDAIDAAPGENASQLEELTRIYMTGDVDAMYVMTTGTEHGGVGGFEKMLLVNRNRNWIGPIKEQVATGPTLFAVGAGHLGGPEGVVRLLRAEGYTLTPLSIR